MPKTFEFFFDYGSAYSYLAWAAMPGFLQRTGATVRYRPMALGGLFKTTGNRPPFEVPAKQAWLHNDVHRSAQRAGIPFRMPTTFPVNSLHLMRGAIVAEQAGALAKFSEVMFNAVWRDHVDLTDPATVGKLVAATGMDPKTLLERIADPAIKEQLKANTDEAAKRGAFGAPTFFVGDEMFWGFDRMEHVAEALNR